MKTQFIRRLSNWLLPKLAYAVLLCINALRAAFSLFLGVYLVFGITYHFRAQHSFFYSCSWCCCLFSFAPMLLLLLLLFAVFIIISLNVCFLNHHSKLLTVMLNFLNFCRGIFSHLNALLLPVFPMLV